MAKSVKHAETLARVEPLGLDLDAAEVFRRLAGRPYPVYFDSARRDGPRGRYSFVSADPFDLVRSEAGAVDSLDQIVARLQPLTAETLPELPPFQGGAAGLFAYDLGRQFEQIPPAAADPFGMPWLAVGFYDVVVAFDHHEENAWIISQGFPRTEPELRQQRAEQRLAQFRRWIEEPGDWLPPATTDVLPRKALGPHHPVAGAPDVVSNFTRDGYLTAVARAIEYIRAGDVFQVNLSQRLLHPARDRSLDLYLRLRERNPAPFAGYFDLGDFQVVSASPERFLQLRGGQVETRPIKGTRHRPGRPEADLFTGEELRDSGKDRAENVMIVDLLRNDLSRVCLPESVSVSQLCGVETFQYVQHLVSVVGGTLRAECGPLDLLRATFPGGSITGAPKVRAMEIIAELEPTVRGPYCGSLGYVGFDGSMDTSILIRTVTAGKGWWQAPVGGGIVAASTPELEFEETLHKAEGLLRGFV